MFPMLWPCAAYLCQVLEVLTLGASCQITGAFYHVASLTRHEQSQSFRPAVHDTKVKIIRQATPHMHQGECGPQFRPLKLAFILGVSHAPLFPCGTTKASFWAQSIFESCLGSYVVHCGASMVHFGVPSWPFSQLLALCHRKEVGSSRNFSSAGAHWSVLNSEHSGLF